MKKSTKKKIVKQVKKINPLSILIVIFFMSIGIGFGLITFNYMISEDDFYVLGQKDIVLNVNDSFVYSESGAKAISYGKDISQDIKIEYIGFSLNDEGACVIDTTKEKKYFVIYTVDDSRYKNIKRIRTITVKNMEVANEI